MSVIYCPHAGVGGEIALHIRLGLRHGDADVLGQRKGGDAVHNAEIHRLGAASASAASPPPRHVEHLGGGDGVDVLAGQERLLHGLVAGHMGQQPQLDLGVVRIHQHIAAAGTNIRRSSLPSSVRVGCSADSAPWS